MAKTIRWSLLEGLRRLRRLVLPLGSRRRRAGGTFLGTVEALLHEGPGTVFGKAANRLRLGLRGHGLLVRTRPPEALNDQYRAWLQRHYPVGHDPERMQAELASFAFNPRISVVTPVYNSTRSVVVVLPASMWAMMPMFRVLSSGTVRAMIRFSPPQGVSAYQR